MSAYGSMTYEELVQAILDRVPSDVDNREGSIIYDAVAPCAYFLVQQNFQLDNFVDLVLPDKAEGEYLDIITAGTDRETDDALRSRFFVKVQIPATSGNAYHYQQWALEVPGTGAAKVFPLDDGPGTVTVLVVDDDMEISSSLPATVAEYIETVRPIGATVTVESPEALTITISANVLLDGSREIADVKADFEAAAESFLKASIFTNYRISYARLSALLLDVAGVEDFDGFTLNSGTGNVMIGDKQIPVLGTVSLTEVDVLGID